MKMIQLEIDEGDCEVVSVLVVRSVWCMYVGLSWGPISGVFGWRRADGRVAEGMGAYFMGRCGMRYVQEIYNLRLLKLHSSRGVRGWNHSFPSSYW